MTRRTVPRTLRVLAAGVAACALVGCGNEYPKGWAGIEHGVLASVKEHGCPNLTGTYRLHALSPNELSWSLPTLLDEPRVGLAGANMLVEAADTLSLSGDANRALTLTYARSPETMLRARERFQNDNKILSYQYDRMLNPETRHSGRYAQMTDQQYEDILNRFFLPATRSRTIEYGHDYHCSGGWLTTPRTEQDTHARRDDRPGPMVENGVHRLGKDTTGYLVADTEFRHVAETWLWCGDGCKGHIPLGTWTQHQWAHWAPAQPAAIASATRPWALAPRLDPVELLPSMQELRDGPRVSPVDTKAATGATPEPIAKLIAPLLPVGVTLESMVAAGDGYKLIAFADTQAQIAQLLRNIQGAPAFKPPDLIKTFKNSSNGRFETHIYVFEKR